MAKTDNRIDSETDRAAGGEFDRALDMRLRKIEKALHLQDEALAEIRKLLISTVGPPKEHVKLKRIEMTLQSLVRASAMDGDDVGYPERLTLRRFRLRSQNEEDGLTYAILREAGFATRTFVELGCGENGGNSGFLAADLGWGGLMVDGSEDRLRVLRTEFPWPRVTAVQAWITRERVDELIRENNISGEIDLLSIDIDGNDYWIWEAVSTVSPRLVIVEYNSFFGPERAVVVPYDEGFERRAVEVMKGSYYGASLRALAILATKIGYRLVAVEPRGTNAYFLRNDLAPHVPEIDPHDNFRLLNKYAAAIVGGFDVYTTIAQEGLPLVDVELETPDQSPRGL